MTWTPERPYNQLPLLPPEIEHFETRRVLKACISARAALKTAGGVVTRSGLTDKPTDHARGKRFFPD